MEKLKKVILILGIAGYFFCCSPASKIPSQEIRSDKVISSSPGPSWVWDPKYYVYDGKKYRFIRGHYRKVLSRKAYFRKSLEGYTSKRKRGNRSS